VSTARVQRWINLAYRRICDREAWPFLETELTGQTAPVTIADVRAVLFVIDTTNENPVVWEDLRTLRERDPNLDDTGDPECWYLDGDELKIWPLSSNSLTVRYLKTPSDLTSADGPLIPDRYQYVLVDSAVAQAYADSDNYGRYNAASQLAEMEIQEMKEALFVPNYDQAATVAASFNASTDW
jgi:hypothetical protein